MHSQTMRRLTRLLPLAILLGLIAGLSYGRGGIAPSAPPAAEAEFSQCGTSGKTMTVRAHTPDPFNFTLTNFGVSFSYNPLTGQPANLNTPPFLDNGTGIIVLPNICVGDGEEFTEVQMTVFPLNCTFYNFPKFQKYFPTPRDTGTTLVEVVFISDQLCVSATQTPTFTPIPSPTRTATPTPLPGTTPAVLNLLPAQPAIGCSESTLVNVSLNNVTGGAVADGTLVTLTTSIGTINPPQATTTNGALTAVLTAPADQGGNATLVASGRSVSNFTTVRINCGSGAPATPTPASAAASASAASTPTPASASGAGVSSLVIRPPNTGSAGLHRPE